MARQYEPGLRTGDKLRLAVERCAAAGRLDDAILAASEWWAVREEGGINERARRCPNLPAALAGKWLDNIVREARRREAQVARASQRRPEFTTNADYEQLRPLIVSLIRWARRRGLNSGPTSVASPRL